MSCGVGDEESQSPEGSLADFHSATGSGGSGCGRSRNPPKGPSPISTLLFRSPTTTSTRSQSPEGSLADFH